MEYPIYFEDTDNILGKRARKRRKARKKLKRRLKKQYGSGRKARKALKSKYGVRRIGLVSKARQQALKKGMDPDDPEQVKSQIRGIRRKRRKIGKIAAIGGAAIGATALALKGKPTKAGKLMRRMKLQKGMAAGKTKPGKRLLGGLFRGRKKRLGGPPRPKGGLFRGKRATGLTRGKSPRKERQLFKKSRGGMLGRLRTKREARRARKSTSPKKGLGLFRGKKPKGRGLFKSRKPKGRGRLKQFLKKKIADPFTKLIPLKRTMVRGLKDKGISASTSEPIGTVSNKFYNQIVVPSRSNFWNYRDINEDHADDAVKQSIVKGILEYIAIAKMNASKGEASPIEEKVARGAEQVEESIEEKVREEAAQEAGQSILFDTKTQLMIAGIIVLIIVIARKTK